MTILFAMDQDIDFNHIYKGWNSNKKTIFWIAIYFAIYSSIQLNIILAGYCSWLLIINFIHNNNKLNTKKFLINNRIYLIIITLWATSVFFDANGARANMLQKSSNSNQFFMQPITSVLSMMMDLASNINKMMLLTFFILVIYTLIKRKKIIQANRSTIIEYMYLIILTCIYLTLLYAKTGGTYSSRPDAIWALISYFLVSLSVCFSIFIEYCRKFSIAIPALLLMFIVAINQNRSYSNGVYGYDYATYVRIDDYIIEQIVQADLAGENSVEVKVPDEHNDSNWPHPYNMAQWLQNTLYSHKIIRRRIKIIIIPSEEVNKLFYYDTNSMEQFTDLEG